MHLLHRKNRFEQTLDSAREYLPDPGETEFRSFRIVDEVVTEEEVRVVEHSPVGEIAD